MNAVFRDGESAREQCLRMVRGETKAAASALC